MDPQIRAQFAQLLRTFCDVFSKSEWDIGKCDLVQHKIDLYPGSKPVKLPNRRMPMHFKKDLRQKIDKFLEHKLITPCHSPYSSPAMLVLKKNGKLRLVIDYRQLNKQTVKSCWPIPSVEEIFDTLEGSCYFSTIDMSWGFYQLPLETNSQDYTAFSTPFGSFKWLVMPMGLTGSPPVFQSLMEKVLVGLTWKSTIPYLDDCIIFSRTAEEHIERLREVFQRYKDANLKINPLKCEFFRQHVPFLGHIVSRDGIQADPAKTSAVRQYPVPKSVTQVKSFLGLCSYYRRYVCDFAAIARPLHQLTEKTKEFHWNPEAHKAFEQLKDCFTSTPSLAFPSVNEPFILYTDASQFAIGAVLAQVQNGLERVICYASKSLNKAQSRYSTTKRELLAIVNYTRHFKHYLPGRRFKIITDHRALQWLHNFKDPDALTARWLEKLAAFDNEIEHRSGKSIGHADCMSRLPATTAALNMTATMDIDASVVGQPNHSSQNLPSFNRHTPPAQPSHSTTIPRDTVQSNSQTDHEQSEVRNGNEVVENTNGQTDDEQSGITHGHEAGANKPVSQFTLIEQQGDLLDFPHSIAQCISAEFKLWAGLAKQINEKFLSYFPTEKEYKQQVLHAQYLGHDKFVFHLIVKPRYFHKPTYRSLRKALSALRDQMNFYRSDKLGIPHLSCGLDKLDWTEVQKIIHETFKDSKLELTVFTLETPRERTTSDNQHTAVDLQKAQTTDTGINQVLTWVRKQSLPPRSYLQGLPRNVWKMWNLFDELTIRQGILCRKHENLKTG